jgi:hypothetical protein
MTLTTMGEAAEGLPKVVGLMERGVFKARRTLQTHPA